jgi:hypothetical protein
MLPIVLANVDPVHASSRELAHTAVVEAVLHDGALLCVRWCGESVD